MLMRAAQAECLPFSSIIQSDTASTLVAQTLLRAVFRGSAIIIEFGVHYLNGSHSAEESSVKLNNRDNLVFLKEDKPITPFLNELGPDTPRYRR